ncbi:MAG: hypothetical protein A2104_10390 [Candidatus Melainabacteria bacterium GWF2_32_7]|nr:MAG: hypothetical protein A2104_10390 [Candidatus Melainabacteria bacterium GWF2_32_7]
MDNRESISIGIDIGGTKISAAAVNNGQIISEVLSFGTPNNIEGIVNTIFEAIEILKDQYNAKFVGIATAGTVNLDNSRVTGSTGNLPKGYNTIEFKKIIEEKYGLKTLIENDANAAGYAEYKIGNAKGDRNTVVLTLGTGIGGGVIVDGKLLKGKSGGAAECGHIPIIWGKKRPCTCGGWDCWEAYASGTGYAKNAQEMAREIPLEERTGLLKDKNPEDLTTYDIIEGLSVGDSFAKKVHDHWEELVVLGLIAYSNIFDPDSIILSGGMAKFVTFEKVEKELNERIVVPYVKVLHAKAENYAGIIGAAILATEKFESEI